MVVAFISVCTARPKATNDTNEPSLSISEMATCTKCLSRLHDPEVLVVDDDEGVRDLARETLERAGLQVICADNTHQAVELFRCHSDEIRLIILDRTMPTRRGSEAFDIIRRITPDKPIILVSGYSMEPGSQRFVAKGLTGFLQKPFLPETLLAQARALLNGISHPDEKT